MDELWIYTTTDDTGAEGVGWVETASGTRIPLVAHDEAGARQYKLIAARMATMTGRPWVLRRYTSMKVMETAEPETGGSDSG